MIKVPPGAIPIGESLEEVGVAAIAACQITLPEGWTVDAFGQEMVEAIIVIPGYVEQARNPHMEVIGGALHDIRDAAMKLTDAVAVEFDDGPTSHSAAGAMRRRIQSRIRRELMGFAIHEGELLNFRPRIEIDTDGVEIHHNNPVHDFLRDLGPRLRLVQRAIESTYELTAAETEMARMKSGTKKSAGQKPGTRNRMRSVGARVVNALVRDLLDMWIKIFRDYPKVTPLWQGRQDGKLSAGKQFPALVRFACQRGGIVVSTDNALHLEIVRAVAEHRERKAAERS
jgi:hypothetical protein